LVYGKMRRNCYRLSVTGPPPQNRETVKN
jgi:hypothetical protein